MKPRSCKAKGRRFQQEVRDLLLKFAPSLEPDDVRSTSMGASGEDILFSPAARRIYPYNIECKNVESLNIWKAVDQAESQGNHIPLVAFKKNNKRAFVAIPLEHFMELLAQGPQGKESW